MNIDSLPPWLAWIQYLSIMRWSFSGLMINEFGTDIDVGGNGGGKSGTSFNCRDVDTEAGDTCIRDGSEVIKRLNFDGETVQQAILALLGMTIGFNLMAYGCLRFKKRTHQRMSPETDQELPAKGT